MKIPASPSGVPALRVQAQGAGPVGEGPGTSSPASAPLVPRRAPSTAELLRSYRTVALRSPTPAECDAVRGLSESERRQFAATLNALAALRQGSIGSVGYMLDVMKAAAEISGKDGPEFVRLVHFSFSEPASWGSRILSVERWLAGGGADTAGSMLEMAFSRIFANHNTVCDGYNANIVDSTNSKSDVVHHFGEFLKVGASRPKFFANLVAKLWDHSKVGSNAGDDRNGNLAIMLGSALSEGKCTPQQAVELTRWAFMPAPGEAPPPWGLVPDAAFVDPERFNLSDWLKAYQKAHPGRSFAPMSAAYTDAWMNRSLQGALAPVLAQKQLSADECKLLQVALESEGSLPTEDSDRVLGLWSGKDGVEMSSSSRKQLAQSLGAVGYALPEETGADASPLDRFNLAEASNVAVPDGDFARLCSRLGSSKDSVPVAAVDGEVDAKNPVLSDKLIPVPSSSHRPPDTLALNHGTEIAGLVTSGTRALPLIFEPVVSSPLQPAKVAAAIDDAVKRGARLVNLSFNIATPEAGSIVGAAIRRHPGVLFVKSAGNNGAMGEAGADALVTQQLPNVATIAASNPDGTPWSKSNRGASFVTDAAVGANVISTFPNDRFAEDSGTSMASARYLNLAGKCLVLNPSLTPVQLKTLLADTSTKSVAWRGLDAAGGVVSEHDALRVAALGRLLQDGIPLERAVAKLELAPADAECLAPLARQFARAQG